MSDDSHALVMDAVAAGCKGDHVRALQLLQEALRVHPESSDIMFDLALVLKQMGRLDEARQAYERVLALHPADTDAMYNLANLHSAMGARESALHWYAETLRVRPEHVGACNNLGAMCEATGEVERAADLYRRAVDADPLFVEGLVNLGSALCRLGRGQEAEECLRRALALNESSAEAHNNLGGILRERGDLTGAEGEYRRAMTLRPGFVEAMNNLALTLHADGRLSEEIDILRFCLEARPEYADAHHNLAIAYLTAGRLEEGWAEYEWRFHTARQENPFRSFDQPCWNGGAIAGKKILLHAEQGLGDTLQFVRYAVVLAEEGATVIVESQRDLLPLLSRMQGIQAVARGDQLPPFDLHCPLLSVPRRCKTTLENIPASIPYLHADPVLVKKWRHQMVRTDDRVRVGVVWAGNPTHPNDRDRSLTPSLLSELRTPGMQLYALQRGETVNSHLHEDIVDLGPQIRDVSDLAAVLEHLDLVIAVDTAVAHLAGAMGKPVWLLLSRIPDWRWMLDRSDTPWYPTMRLFRQHNRGKWDDAYDEVRKALAELAEQRVARQEAIMHPSATTTAPIADRVAALEAKQQALRSAQRGLELAGGGRFFEAESAFREAIAIDPTCSEALGYLGRLLRDRGELDQAERLFGDALASSPDDADLHVRLAEVLTVKKAFTKARRHLLVAASLQPNEPTVLTGFGDLSWAQDQSADARSFYQRALDADPANASLCVRMGSVCRACGDVEESALWYEQALFLDPDHADAHWQYAQYLLLSGCYEQGWEEYEWRWKHPRFATPSKQFRAPQWQGEPLSGRKILLYAEQGFGDVIQFIRYAPVLAAAGAEVHAGIPPELGRLLGNVEGVRAICLDPGAVPPVDYQCPLLGVPRLVGTTSETIPFEGPYIHADNVIRDGWERRLGDVPGTMRIGIAWAGSKHHENDRHRSCSLQVLAPLLGIDGVSWVSLQKDGVQLDSLQRDIPMRVLNFEHDLTDFAETAGLIACLDLVIAIDSAVAHLAGAMGKRVWTLLPFAPDWRWGLKTATTPWYPTMRLYRQPVPSAWGEVVVQVKNDLQKLMDTASH